MGGSRLDPTVALFAEAAADVTAGNAICPIKKPPRKSGEACPFLPIDWSRIDLQILFNGEFDLIPLGVPVVAHQGVHL